MRLPACPHSGIGHVSVKSMFSEASHQNKIGEMIRTLVVGVDRIYVSRKVSQTLKKRSTFRNIANVLS